MNKEEILQWANKYDTEFPYWTKIEKELGGKLRASKELTKPELLQIVEWKFNNQIWLKKQLKSASNNDDEIVRVVTRNVFNSSDDYFRMNNLQRLDGIGGAVASVILTFYDPKKYGVFDRHVWRAFFGDFSTKQYLWTTGNYLKRLLPELTNIAGKYCLNVRTVEKAYAAHVLQVIETTKHNTECRAANGQFLMLKQKQTYYVSHSHVGVFYMELGWVCTENRRCGYESSIRGFSLFVLVVLRFVCLCL